MNNTMKNLIRYEGINPSTNLCGNQTNYKQSNFDGVQCIPACKPNIEQIVKVWGSVDISHYEIVDTPVGTSVEGQQLTGRKMLLVGDITFKVQYVACDMERSVHTAHVSSPFCEYIVLPANYNVYCYLAPQAYVEDVYVNLLDFRSFFYNIMILFVAKTC